MNARCKFSLLALIIFALPISEANTGIAAHNNNDIAAVVPVSVHDHVAQLKRAAEQAGSSCGMTGGLADCATALDHPRAPVVALSEFVRSGPLSLNDAIAATSSITATSNKTSLSMLDIGLMLAFVVALLAYPLVRKHRALLRSSLLSA